MSTAAPAVWPVGHLEAANECPACGGVAREMLHTDLTDVTFGAAPGRWTLYRCASCGSAYLDPRPDAASIGLAYARYYTHQVRPVSDGGWLRRGVLAAAYGYLNSQYGLAKQPASRVGAVLCRLIPPFRGYLDALMRYLPPPPATGGELLDVGCGHGAFLAMAREAGWKVRGLDFDPRAVEAAGANGIDVRSGGIEALAEESARYDCITMSHVVEHVHAPLDQLTDVFRLLKPGGTVWIETPNIDALGHERFGRDWRGLEVPRHLVIFSERALRAALARAGFEEVCRRYRGAIAPLIYAESESIRRREPLGSVPVFRQPNNWRVVSDTVVEELSPGRREFLTFTARKPR